MKTHGKDFDFNVASGTAVDLMVDVDLSQSMEATQAIPYPCNRGRCGTLYWINR